MQLSPTLHKALESWRRALGERNVLDPEKATRVYGPNTEGVTRNIAGGLKPKTVSEVVAAVKIASRFRIPLYPVSGGKNWGYGSAIPPRDGCVIVDLSRMNRILEMDEKLGLVTVEAGVTQGQLHRYLTQHKLPYMISINAAGTQASLVGQALDRGIENFPYMDRFSSVMTLEAVLPNGEIYRPTLSALGATLADRAHKWGIGPYFDGIFSQGNFGIITSMTFALAKAPDRIDIFSFAMNTDAKLEQFVDRIREVYKTIGGMMGLVRVGNVFRTLAFLGAPYPFKQVKQGKAVSPKLAGELCARYGIAAWNGGGSLFGPEKAVDAFRAYVKKMLKPCTDRLRFLTFRKGEAQYAELLSARDLGLVEAYWKKGKPASGVMNPAQDGCGYLAYAPLVPLKPKETRAFVAMTRRICAEHGIDSEASLLIATSRYFYGVTPMVFNPADPEEVKRVHACYEALFTGGKKLGLLPYRTPAHAMKLVTDPSLPSMRLGRLIKKAADPLEILSPGRYTP